VGEALRQPLERAETAVQPLVRVRDLSVGFAVEDGGVVRAADRVSFDVMAGKTLGLVGESGCGKSVTLRSLIGLQHPGEVLGGEVLLRGRDLLGFDKDALRRVRGSEIAMIFQDPSSALNPVLSIQDQLTEVLRIKRGRSRREALDDAVQLMTRVGIPGARRRIRDYPHQLSGGMRQRLMIALALACRPALLLADEPTTALDVTIQDQILGLLADLQAEYDMAIVLVSHDLGVIAQVCDRVAVMYAGRVVEYGAVTDVLDSPRHPYTEALLSSMPASDPTPDRPVLRTIGGQPPDLADLPSGCSFRSRCSYAEERCAQASMELDAGVPLHGSACLFPERVRR
jgi:oligopeptide/dipeptide ABC transporter ATP-binding protein